MSEKVSNIDRYTALQTTNAVTMHISHTSFLELICVLCKTSLDIRL